MNIRLFFKLYYLKLLLWHFNTKHIDKIRFAGIIMLFPIKGIPLIWYAFIYLATQGVIAADLLYNYLGLI